MTDTDIYTLKGSPHIPEKVTFSFKKMDYRWNEVATFFLREARGTPKFIRTSLLAWRANLFVPFSAFDEFFDKDGDYYSFMKMVNIKNYKQR